MDKGSTTRKRQHMSALVALVASLATASVTSAAVVSNHSAGICHATYGSTSVTLGGPGDLLSGEVATNFNSTRRLSVTCPLVRRTENANGAVIFVDLFHRNGVQTTSCTAVSTAPGNQTLASTSGSFTGTGFGNIRLNLAGLGKSNAASDYTVLCTIPAGLFNGSITGVHLQEQ